MWQLQQLSRYCCRFLYFFASSVAYAVAVTKAQDLANKKKRYCNIFCTTKRLRLTTEPLESCLSSCAIIKATLSRPLRDHFCASSHPSACLSLLSAASASLEYIHCIYLGPLAVVSCIFLNFILFLHSNCPAERLLPFMRGFVASFVLYFEISFSDFSKFSF